MAKFEVRTLNGRTEEVEATKFAHGAGDLVYFYQDSKGQRTTVFAVRAAQVDTIRLKP